ncbi:transcriptional regulator, y4mF family [Salinivirga cyanobacteriivorans]|uniref:Transcriptional regulator, y4mF family n=1 Tax=Salinivirga cyanobacteriivorans TaxID=1307839 RepID=A0A0S2I097_9BACT|nr:helix-turn-helix transcriptional regulator [Salinivirga cyanobacteriivorans]ALO15589.1 transcriptional regulator, y4mF family [Salinivirga cyanobacteriivorans]
MDNILTNKKFNLDRFNPQKIAEEIAQRAKQRRLELNITQEQLARRSGVSFGSVKRFENQAKISLQHLLMIAVALDATDEFSTLFTRQNYKSIDEVTKEKTAKQRKRAR